MLSYDIMKHGSVPVPDALRGRLRTADLSEIGRQTGVSRNTLMKMRDAGGFVRSDKLAQVAKALGHKLSLDNGAMPSENLESNYNPMAADGKPIPEHFRRYHRLLEGLSPERLIRVMEAERDVYNQLTVAYPDPKARLFESVRIALMFLESFHEEEVAADSE